MLIRRTYDEALIDRVLTELWPWISVDQYPEPIPARLWLANADCLIIELHNEGITYGLGALFTNEVHTLFLPSLRGSRAIKAARVAMTWFWDNTTFPYLTSFAYSHRPEVDLFARLMGFRPYEGLDDGSTVEGHKVFRTNFICHRPL